MAKVTPTQIRQFLFVLKFRQFMLINNRLTFSSHEIKAIGKQINNIIGEPNKNYSTQHILKLLETYGVRDVCQKHSHADRSKYWFTRPLCPKTLKVVNI